MSSYTLSAYQREPLSRIDGVPIFSEIDRYVQNYQKIAADHVAAIKPGHANPFMENKLWLDLEDSTRRLILKHVPPDSVILDVGVGLGRVMSPLTQYRRFGIDISMDYLTRARESGIEVAFARIEDMPYADGFFDAVVVCDVLEHVLDLHFCCQQILRVLRPGGTLIVRVPYREDLSAYLSPDLPYEFVHLRNFDEHSLQLMFEKILGCKMLEFDEVAPYLQGPPRMKLRQLPMGAPLYQFLKTIECADAVDPAGGAPNEELAEASPESAVAAAQGEIDSAPTTQESNLTLERGKVGCEAVNRNGSLIRRILGRLSRSVSGFRGATAPEGAISSPTARIEAAATTAAVRLEAAAIAAAAKLEAAAELAATRLETAVNPITAKLEQARNSPCASPPQNSHPLEVLMRSMLVSQDEFTNWIYKLRDEHPDWYEFIIPHVAYGLEINVVVRKPAGV